MQASKYEKITDGKNKIINKCSKANTMSFRGNKKIKRNIKMCCFEMEISRTVNGRAVDPTQCETLCSIIAENMVLLHTNFAHL